MPATNDFVAYVLDQLERLGEVSSRRMFGGHGLYRGEIFFGLISGDTLYFKADAANRSDYEARGMGRFRPHEDKPHLSMNYYELPADVLEDSEQLVAWARRSVAVAQAAAQMVPRRPLRGKKTKTKQAKRLRKKVR
jgi:DNA transformation protein